jgi:hypothetical protein
LGSSAGELEIVVGLLMLLLLLLMMMMMMICGSLGSALTFTPHSPALSLYTGRCNSCIDRPSLLWLACECGGDLVIKATETASEASEISSSSSTKEYCCCDCGRVPSDIRLQHCLK